MGVESARAGLAIDANEIPRTVPQDGEVRQEGRFPTAWLADKDEIAVAVDVPAVSHFLDEPLPADEVSRGIAPFNDVGERCYQSIAKRHDTLFRFSDVRR
jgi:hypothetical protein